MKPSPMPGHELKGLGENHLKKKKKPFVPLWVLRSILALLIIGVVVTSAACRAGFGRVCTFGTAEFGITCPLGYLEMLFASRNLLPKLLPGVGLAVLLILIFGRAFCAWVCPAALITTLKDRISRLFPHHRKLKPGGNFIANGNQVVLLGNNNGNHHNGIKNGGLASLAILGGTLVSSYLFGFPVFCLVCPVGLAFGTIFAVIRLFHSALPGLELLVFPAMLVAEFFLLKSWCSSFCPLGALLGLVSRLNFFLRPKVKKEACLVSRGINCRICEKACPQEVALVKIGKDFNGEDCTKCLECYEKCPTNAIKLKLF